MKKIYSLAESRHRRIFAGVSIACAATIALTVAGISSASAGEDRNFDMSVLSKAKTGVDRLPARVLGGDGLLGAIQPDSTVLLKHDGNTFYWAGINKQKQLCIIVHVDDEDDVYAGSCTDAASFRQGGLGSRVLTPKYAIESYLVPDEAKPASRQSNSANLTSFDPLAVMVSSRKSVAAANTNSGFKLRMLSPVDPSEIPGSQVEK
jgi:hypothetical protein